VTVRELSKFATIGKRLWKARSLRAAFQLLRKSAGHMLDGWFESDPIKAVLGFDAVVGNLASPYMADSAYVLLHHALGELNGKSGVWGYAIGGMGAITQAMARVAAKHGAPASTFARRSAKSSLKGAALWAWCSRIDHRFERVP